MTKNELTNTKKINPSTLLFTFTFCISLIFSLIIIVSTSLLIKKTSKEIMSKYYESCETSLKGYNKAIELKIENYFTALNTFFDDDFLAPASNNEIQQFLISHKYKNHSDFATVFYVDKTGTEYSQSGKIYKVLERDYFNGIIKDGKDYFISSPVEAKSDKHIIFVIAKAVKDSNRNTKGMICASIELDRLKETLKDINISITDSIMIIDENGKFIANPDSSLLFKSFTPSSKEYKQYSSLYVAQKREGILQTEINNSEMMMLFFTPTKNTTWTTVLSVPLSEFQKIQRKQNLKVWIVVIVGLISLVFMLFLEFITYRHLQKKQKFTSVYDQITNLWTKEKFEIEAKHMLKNSPKSKFMMLEADIRGFKFVNENYGEEMADNMIKFYGHMMNDVCKKEHGIMCRAYADHFYIFIKIPSTHKAMVYFKKDLEIFSDQIKRYVLPFTPKFGISFYNPENNTEDVSIQGLIGQASFAKSAIKDDALTQYSVFDSKLLEKRNEEIFIESNMESALANEEFFVMYQPKISLKTNKIIGAEALVRWNNKQYGLLPPDRFIPLFERNGFVTQLDFYVYTKVFEFIQRQISQNDNIVPISVNMSRNHGTPDVFMNDFSKIFRRYKVPSQLVQVEILERSFMDNNNLKEITDRLHAEGFSVAMDDFGSGESSLNMLTSIPIDVIKFDRMFLKESTDKNGKISVKSELFIKSLIELCKNLGKETVFEGVETVSQRDFLKETGCDIVQGYYYSKPLKESEFIDFMKENI